MMKASQKYILCKLCEDQYVVIKESVLSIVLELIKAS